MTLEHLLLFMLLAAVAEVLGTVGGFGSSVFFVPIASYFLEIHVVLGITALFHVLSNITKLVMFPRAFDKKILKYLGMTSVVAVLAGAYLSKFMPTETLKLVMAFLLIALSIFFIIFQSRTVKPTNFNMMWTGTTSGFLAGLIGTGGAIRGMALSAFNLEKDVFIATSAFIDLFVDGSRAIVYAANGFIQKENLYLIPVLLISTLLGTFVGKKLLDRLPQQYFRNIVLTFIFLVGLYTVLEHFVKK